MYDCVIVGAGSAGCILAARLTEDPDTRVLLVEAGPADTSDFVHVPAAFSALFRTERDWDHMSAWEPGCNGRRIYLPRGRMLGGSSSMNAMIYIRGNRADYDEWAANGCAGWSYDDLLPYFKRAEDNERGANEWHGAGGPLPVSEGRARTRLPRGGRRGRPAGEPGLQRGRAGRRRLVPGHAARRQARERRGRLPAPGDGAAEPRGPHRRLRAQGAVRGHARRGIQAAEGGELVELRAEREVIVSGGAYNSPQLLMLSGLGRPEELGALQIPVVAEAPEVGLNLSDHPTAGVVYATEEECSLKDALTEENIGHWMGGGGPLTSNLAESGGFVRTRDGLEAPDIQFHMVAAMYMQEGLLPPPAHGITLSACVLQPRSRGQVALVGPDPTTKPLILHNYFDDPEDLRSAIEGVRLTMQITQAAPLSRYAQQPVFVPASDSDADVEAQVRDGADDLPPGRDVPDGLGRGRGRRPELRVRGVDALRVVDAAVNAERPAREHERADDRARRAGGRPHPRDGRGGGAERGGGRCVASTQAAAWSPQALSIT